MIVSTSSTLLELRHALDCKEISACELLSMYWEKIKSCDPQIHAFITLPNWDDLYQQARATDERLSQNHSLGFWDGLPIAVKDNICTQGIRTTCGSRMLENFIPSYDAHVIQVIKNQGGIILGKTNLDEFAMGSSTENSAFFVTRNPHNLAYTPGGSSGGSAVAVASGEAPIALGSDTGGSVRQPAAFTGLVGLKPTYGRVSRRGLIAFASSLDQIGILGRNVSDVALALPAMITPDPLDNTYYYPVANLALPNYFQALNKHTLSGAKVGIPQEYFTSGLDPQVATIIESCLQKIEKAGAVLCPIQLPHTEYAVATYYLIATAEASANLARYDGVRYGFRANCNSAVHGPEVHCVADEKNNGPEVHCVADEKNNGPEVSGPKLPFHIQTATDIKYESQASSLDQMYCDTRSQGFGWEVKRRILLGTYCLSQGYYSAYYEKACQVRSAIKQEIDLALQNLDFLVTPTSPIPAFLLGTKCDPLAMYLCDIFTITFSLSGQPAISIPCGFTQDRLPIGLQIVTPHFTEDRLLSYAYLIEKLL